MHVRKEVGFLPVEHDVNQRHTIVWNRSCVCACILTASKHMHADCQNSAIGQSPRTFFGGGSSTGKMVSGREAP